MRRKRVLVVYYSRTGTTRRVARAIQSELDCEMAIERITDRVYRHGVLGYLRSSLGVLLGGGAKLRPMMTDPKDFDLVIVGTPVWNGSVATPVRTYLTMNRDHIDRVAFFCTFGGTGSARAFRQMTEACGRAPIGVMALRSSEVAHGSYLQKVRAFVGAFADLGAPQDGADLAIAHRPIHA